MVECDRWELSRRDCLRLGLGAALAGVTPAPLLVQADATATPAPAPKSVAAVVTSYTHNSHADVILNKILQRLEARWRAGTGVETGVGLHCLNVSQQR